MFSADSIETGTSLPELVKWVRDIADLTQPDEVVWCDGSDDEWEQLTSLLVENRTFTRLNPELRPNNFWCRSDPGDVARVEDRTFICSERESDAGPTNNWIAPDEMRTTFAEIFDGAIRGRVMYVVPFCMGPLGGEISQLRVEITDSAYVAVSMRIMTRMGTPALRAIEKSGSFVRCVHSVGAPLAPGRRTCRGRAMRPSTSRTSPRPGRSGPTGRATAGTRCWARSATRCGSPR
jgi:phosphoenolpyruvate carboxykinase (GTP)